MRHTAIESCAVHSKSLWFTTLQRAMRSNAMLLTTGACNILSMQCQGMSCDGASCSVMQSDAAKWNAPLRVEVLLSL